jgi:hypothetical protein
MTRYKVYALHTRLFRDLTLTPTGYYYFPPQVITKIFWSTIGPEDGVSFSSILYVTVLVLGTLVPVLMFV